MKRIEIQKNDDGTFEVLDGCSIEKFNEGGGLIVTNQGVPKDGAVQVFVRIQNNLPGCNSYYRLGMNIESENEIDDILHSAGCSIRKTCKNLFGADGYREAGSSTYKEFDSDCKDRAEHFSDSFAKKMIENGFVKGEDGIWRHDEIQTNK